MEMLEKNGQNLEGMKWKNLLSNEKRMAIDSAVAAVKVKYSIWPNNTITIVAQLITNMEGFKLKDKNDVTRGIGNIFLSQTVTNVKNTIFFQKMLPASSKNLCFKENSTHNRKI